MGRDAGGCVVNSSPDNWPALCLQVRAEAGNRCEWCKVANYAEGARDLSGMWWPRERIERAPAVWIDRWFGGAFPEMICIVLTVVHLNHDTVNRQRSNLAALCQICQARHDQGQHWAKASAKPQRKREEAVAASGQQRMW